MRMSRCDAMAPPSPPAAGGEGWGEKGFGKSTAKAVLKVVRESQTFWISSEPPVKKNLAALMEAYGLSLGEHLNYGCETRLKRSFGGLAVAVLEAIV